MKTGKLDNSTLERIVLNKIKYRRDEVKVSPAVGEDCAVIDFGDYNCVMSTDPITAAVKDIGRLAINISCNDIASNGCQPLGIMLTVMLPPEITEEEIARIMDDAADEAAKVKVQIIGGHTEITPVVKAPVISATAVGRQPVNDGVYRKAAPGDYIIMTKAVGLEGSGIIASDRTEECRKFLNEDEIAEAESYLEETSVVREGVIAGKAGAGPMHDVTEGGIAGALWEITRIGGVGADVDFDRVPVRPVTKKICDHYGLNPYRLISSGCMLIIAQLEALDRLKAAFAEGSVDYTVIGRIVPEGEGVKIDPPGSDELMKALYGETDITVRRQKSS
ncbi:MAG: AIR synthase family protein [Anaerovoracaceae bacterium]|nr:AIR synthase family protein [Bacillota bacterium]MDY2671013.1 AIR synthase family protein [Anaerovoracaceae bacterium]